MQQNVSFDTINLTPFKDALDAYRRGQMIILIDDADRENEGDLCVASQHVTAEQLQFMATHGRGLTCVSISKEVAQRLSIPYQVEHNSSPFHTPFTVTIDHVYVAKCGMLPSSKEKTIKALIDPNSTPADFVSPGASFPLIANPAGVLGRNGQTEGSFDLARLAGLTASGVICEILAPDGTMLRGKQLEEFAKNHNLPITSVAEIAKARLGGEVMVRKVAQSTISTDYGQWTAIVFNEDATNKEHIALVYGDALTSKTPVLTRLHSECLTGDVFGSLRCDCGEQLKSAQQLIVKNGSGIILYLRQEGRGIGLTNKLKAYALQDTGLDTVQANLELGFAADERDFQVGVNILSALNIKQIRLLTNNPEKMSDLNSGGIEVVERVPIVVKSSVYSKDYMDVKRTKLGHMF
jgi:3,4-dihydroxy 2-butanone 4-phosphate synthase/GTP cyclohydrolase II